jgi:hypothetical protein
LAFGVYIQILANKKGGKVIPARVRKFCAIVAFVDLFLLL